MKPAVDRAAVAIGVAALASAVVGLLPGTFQFVHYGAGGFVVALVVGALAAIGGWFGVRVLVLLCGAAFLLAAIYQLVTIGRSGDVFRGNGSTVSFWLGLGVGLLALAASPRSPTPRSP